MASFDCDGDGLPEVYVTGGVGKAKFYRNRSSRGGPIKLLEERSGLELTGANGAVISEGDKVLRDPGFLRRGLRNDDDPLRHEKRLLDDWLADILPRNKN